MEGLLSTGPTPSSNNTCLLFNFPHKTTFELSIFLHSFYLPTFIIHVFPLTFHPSLVMYYFSLIFYTYYSIIIICHLSHFNFHLSIVSYHLDFNKYTLALIPYHYSILKYHLSIKNIFSMSD